MTTSHAPLLLAVIAGALIGSSLLATNPAQAETSTANGPQVVRVFYLQGMDSSLAGKMLIREADVRHIAWDRGFIVVSDVPDIVDKCEKFLREQHVLVRATDPHKPVKYERLPQSPTATRVFRVQSVDNMKMTQTLLRAIYDVVGEMQPEGKSVSVSAAQPILDASEALLRELGFLSVRGDKEPAGTDKPSSP